MASIHCSLSGKSDNENNARGKGSNIHVADRTHLPFQPKNNVGAKKMSILSPRVPSLHLSGNSVPSSSVADGKFEESASVATSANSYIGTVAGTVYKESDSIATDVNSYIGTVAGTTNKDVASVAPSVSSYIGTVAGATNKDAASVGPLSVNSYIGTVAGTFNRESESVAPLSVNSYIGTVAGTTNKDSAPVGPLSVNSYIGTVAGTINKDSASVGLPSVNSYIGTVAGTTNKESASVATTGVNSYIGTVASNNETASISSNQSTSADKYGTTLESYESFSSLSINPRTESILLQSRNYFAGRERIGLNKWNDENDVTKESDVASSNSVESEEYDSFSIEEYVGLGVALNTEERRMADDAKTTSTWRKHISPESRSVATSHIGTVSGVTVQSVLAPENVRRTDVSTSSYIGTVSGVDKKSTSLIAPENVGERRSASVAPSVSSYIGTVAGTVDKESASVASSATSYVGTVVATRDTASIAPSLNNSYIGTVAANQDTKSVAPSISSYVGTVVANRDTASVAPTVVPSVSSYIGIVAGTVYKESASVASSATSYVGTMVANRDTVPIAANSCIGTVAADQETKSVVQSVSSYLGTVASTFDKESASVATSVNSYVGTVVAKNDTASIAPGVNSSYIGTAATRSVAPSASSYVGTVDQESASVATSVNSYVGTVAANKDTAPIATSVNKSYTGTVAANQDAESLAPSVSTYVTTVGRDTESVVPSISSSSEKVPSSIQNGMTVETLSMGSMMNLRSEEILKASRNYVETRDKCGITSFDSISDAETVTTLDRIIADIGPHGRDKTAGSYAGVEASDNFIGKSNLSIPATQASHTCTFSNTGSEGRPAEVSADTVATNNSVLLPNAGTSSYTSDADTVASSKHNASVAQTSTASHIGTVQTSTSSYVGTIFGAQHSDISITGAVESLSMHDGEVASSADTTGGSTRQGAFKIDTQNSTSSSCNADANEVSTPVHVNTASPRVKDSRGEQEISMRRTSRDVEKKNSSLSFIGSVMSKDGGGIVTQLSDASSVGLNSLSPRNKRIMHRSRIDTHNSPSGKGDEVTDNSLSGKSDEVKSNPAPSVVSSDSKFSTKNTWSKGSESKTGSVTRAVSKSPTGMPPTRPPLARAQTTISSTFSGDKYGETAQSYASYSSESMMNLRSEEILKASRNYVETRDKCGITSSDSISDAETVTTLDRIIADIGPHGRDKTAGSYAGVEASDNFIGKSNLPVPATQASHTCALSNTGSEGRPAEVSADTVATNSNAGTSRDTSDADTAASSKHNASVAQSSMVSHIGTVQTSTSSYVGTIFGAQDSDISVESLSRHDGEVASSADTTGGSTRQGAFEIDTQNSTSSSCNAVANEVSTPAHVNTASPRVNDSTRQHNRPQASFKDDAGVTPDLDVAQNSVVESSSRVVNPFGSVASIDESREEIQAQLPSSIGSGSVNDASSIRSRHLQTPFSDPETHHNECITSSSNSSPRSTEAIQSCESESKTASIVSNSSDKCVNPSEDINRTSSSHIPSMASCNDSTIHSNETESSSIQVKNPTSTPNQEVIDQSESFTSNSIKSCIVRTESEQGTIVKASSYTSVDASNASNERYGIETQQSNASSMHLNKVIIRQSGSHVSASLAEKACYTSDDDTMPTLMSSESPSSHASSIPPPLMSFDSMASSRRSKYRPTVCMSESPSVSSLHLKKPPPSPRGPRNQHPLMRSNSKQEGKTIDESSRSNTGSAIPSLTTVGSTASSKKPGVIDVSRQEISTKESISQASNSTHSTSTVTPPIYTSKPPASPCNSHVVEESRSHVSDRKDARISTESAADQANSCVDTIKALDSPASAVIIVGDKYGVVQKSDVSSVESNKSSPLQYQSIIKESGSHVSVLLCDHDASTASVNNTFSHESHPFQESNEANIDTSLLVRSDSTPSFKMTPSLSSLEIIRDLESHDVPSINWNTRSIGEPRRNTSDESQHLTQNSDNSPDTVQPTKPPPSPRNQLILDEFKSRLNSLRSPQSQKSVVTFKYPNAMTESPSMIDSTSYSCVEKTLTSFEADGDDTVASLESFESTHVCPPSLKSFEGLIDDADESILDTVLCQRFIQAFETTLASNPGMLPGDLSLIHSLEHTLAKLTRSKDEQEYQMKGRLQKFLNEKFDIESKVNAKKDALGENTDELAEELAKAEQEKVLLQRQYDKLHSDLQATKYDIEQKKNEANIKEENLKKHLADLTASHEQIKASLESETRLLEEERQILAKVNDTRKSIAVQKNDNKTLENQIELMTESISRDKTSLKSQAAELKDFEDELVQLRSSNEETQKELEDERKGILDTTLQLQQRRQALIESKAKLEMELKKEKEDIEHKIEESRIMGSRDFHSKKIAKRKVGGMTIESLIEARIAAELKKKAKSTSRQELEKRENHENVEPAASNGVIKECNSEERPSLLTEDPLTGEVEIESIVRSHVDATLKRKELELHTIEELNSHSSSQLMASSVSTEEIQNTSSRISTGNTSLYSDDGTVDAESFSSGAHSTDRSEPKPMILHRSKSFTPAELTSDRYDCNERSIKVDHLQRSRSFNRLCEHQQS
jgi:hypothetical protein